MNHNAQNQWRVDDLVQAQASDGNWYDARVFGLPNPTAPFYHIIWVDSGEQLTVYPDQIRASPNVIPHAIPLEESEASLFVEENDWRAEFGVMMGVVRIWEDLQVFKDACDNRFEGDSVNGYHDSKAKYLGRSARVDAVHDNATVSVRFNDEMEFILPWEALKEQITYDIEEYGVQRGIVFITENADDFNEAFRRFDQFPDCEYALSEEKCKLMGMEVRVIETFPRHHSNDLFHETCTVEATFDNGEVKQYKLPWACVEEQYELVAQFDMEPHACGFCLEGIYYLWHETTWFRYLCLAVFVVIIVIFASSTAGRIDPLNEDTNLHAVCQIPLAPYYFLFFGVVGLFFTDILTRYGPELWRWCRGKSQESEENETMETFKERARAAFLLFTICTSFTTIYHDLQLILDANRSHHNFINYNCYCMIIVNSSNFKVAQFLFARQMIALRFPKDLSRLEKMLEMTATFIYRLYTLLSVPIVISHWIPGLGFFYIWFICVLGCLNKAMPYDFYDKDIDIANLYFGLFIMVFVNYFVSVVSVELVSHLYTGYDYVETFSVTFTHRKTSDYFDELWDSSSAAEGVLVFLRLLF